MSPELIARGRHRTGFELELEDRPTVTRSMHVALEDLALRRLFVVYPGADAYPLRERTRVLPLAQLADARIVARQLDVRSGSVRQRVPFGVRESFELDVDIEDGPMEANAVVQLHAGERVDRALPECGIGVEGDEVLDALDQQPEAMGRHALQLNAAV